MGTPESVMRNIEKFVNNIPKKSLAGGTVVMLRLKGELEAKVPVDSGNYRSSWQYNKNAFNSGKILSSMSVTNPVKYGYYLETGSFPGHKPWPHPGRKTKVGSDGKIYSTQALKGGDGVVRTLLTNNRVNSMVSFIADRIMGGLA